MNAIRNHWVHFLSTVCLVAAGPRSYGQDGCPSRLRKSNRSIKNLTVKHPELVEFFDQNPNPTQQDIALAHLQVLFGNLMRTHSKSIFYGEEIPPESRLGIVPEPARSRMIDAWIRQNAKVLWDAVLSIYNRKQFNLRSLTPDLILRYGSEVLWRECLTFVTRERIRDVLNTLIDRLGKIDLSSHSKVKEFVFQLEKARRLLGLSSDEESRLIETYSNLVTNLKHQFPSLRKKDLKVREALDDRSTTITLTYGEAPLGEAKATKDDGGLRVVIHVIDRYQRSGIENVLLAELVRLTGDGASILITPSDATQFFSGYGNDLEILDTFSRESLENDSIEDRLIFRKGILRVASKLPFLVALASTRHNRWIRFHIDADRRALTARFSPGEPDGSNSKVDLLITAGGTTVRILPDGTMETVEASAVSL